MQLCDFFKAVHEDTFEEKKTHWRKVNQMQPVQLWDGAIKAILATRSSALTARHWMQTFCLCLCHFVCFYHYHMLIAGDKGNLGYQISSITAIYLLPPVRNTVGSFGEIQLTNFKKYNLGNQIFSITALYCTECKQILRISLNVQNAWIYAYTKN